jgi:tetratricopeptide (TPR) repeat protein
MIRDGEGDTAQADEIRDTMDELWTQLDPQEAVRLRSLSADLNTIGRESALGAPESAGNATLQKLRDAEARHDWEEVLALLREGRDALPADEAAFVRSRSWANLGDLHTALLFLREAVRLAPHRSDYTLFLIVVLGMIGDAEEAARLTVSSSHNGNTDIPPELLELSSRLLTNVEKRREIETKLRELGAERQEQGAKLEAAEEKFREIEAKLRESKMELEALRARQRETMGGRPRGLEELLQGWLSILPAKPATPIG